MRSAARSLELRGGHGSVVELVGNAGMGKTRLLGEFRAEAPDLPHLVAGCELYESSVSYLPFRRLLRLLLGSGGGQDASGVAERLQEDVGRRAPDLIALAAAARDRRRRRGPDDAGGSGPR